MSRDRSGLSVGGGGLPQHARTPSHEAVFHGLLFDRDQLVRRTGRTAGSIDDAQLVLELYAQLGRSILSELRGAFALILLDRRDGTVVATRDLLGMHPLFYSSIDTALVFSWSIDGLLRAGAARDVNRLFVAEHLLRRWRTLDETYFTAIRRVPAGHCLVGRETLHLEEYWDDHPADAPASLEEFEQRLDKAVERCLALGRAGVYLSGGADSVNVAISAVAVTRRKGAEPPVALTVTFPDEGSNEAEIQERVARALGMPRVIAAAVTPGEHPIEVSLLRTADRCAPVGAFWDDAFRTVGVRAQESGCAVLLDGEGGDEWLAPPRQHAGDLLRRLELRRLGRFLVDDVRAAGWRRMRAAAANGWRYALRPALHRAVTARVAHRAPVLHARYRRVRHPLPPWISSDRDLREALSQRIDHPTPPEHCHPLVSMHLEDAYCRGRSIGVPLLHPLWDVDLVRFLASAPPESLQGKALAVESARRRLPELGRDWPRRATADAFLERVVAEEARRADPPQRLRRVFERFGILEPGEVPLRIQTGGNGNGLSTRDLLAIFTAEAWLSRRLED